MKVRKVSTMDERLRWMKANESIWRDMKLVPLPHGSHRLFLNSADQRRLAEAMKEAGLFAPSTYWRDIPVHQYVRTLRGLR